MFMEEDLLYGAENRIRNLMWTVSGNYGQNTRPDLSAWETAKEIALYDAVKQGALARFFDQDALSMYLIKKIYYGAQEQPLTELAQLCIEMGVWRKISAERPGVPEMRRKAFEALLENSFQKMNETLPGRLKIALLRDSLYGAAQTEKKLQDALDLLVSLQESRDVMDLIRGTDVLYNTLIDRGFEREHGDLEKILATPLEDLQEFNWRDFLNEDALEETLEQVLADLSNRVTTMAEEQDEDRKPRAEGKKQVVVLDEKALAKMHTYMELNFGRSYLTEREQKSVNRRLCTGAHADCSLYYTEGILKDPVLVNAQYVNAKKQRANNERIFINNRNFLKRSTEVLTEELRLSLHRRTDPETMNSDYGQVVANRLWRVGRVAHPDRMFVRTDRHDNSLFVVDILIDASGSQRDRQGQVAMQAYILSEALSNQGIPHRIMSFCTFWDYTVMQRFREYDAPRSENSNLLNYTTSSNNRDGLAIRAAGDTLLQREEENKILIVLSDGRPNDVTINRPNSRNPKPYYGEYAARDAAFEVRRLRGQEVHVLGVFAGKEKDLQAEKTIFGKDFAYIRDIKYFSRTAGRYLRKLLEDES